MRILLLTAVLLIGSACFSQTTVYSEDFNTGSTWTLNTITGTEGTYPNTWYISCQEDGQTPGNCGTACILADNSLHVGPNGILGDLGAAYFEGLATTTSRRAESGNISTLGQTNLTLSFDMIGGGNAQDFTELFYSTDGGGSWVSIASTLTSATCPSGQGLWQNNTYALPAACENIANLRIAFVWQNLDDGIASDPSFAVDDILITTPSSSSSITTGAFTPASWCYGTVVTGSLPFTATGTFNPANIYSAELSDAAGSFAAPTVIGSLSSSSSGALSIGVTIPGTLAVGNGYRVRVVASDPSTTGTDNGSDLEVFALPTVALSSFANVCLTDPSFTLSGGSPAGGAYSGPGVSGGMFDPSAAGLGTHTITYTYTNANGCTDVGTSTILVESCSAASIVTGTMSLLSWCYGSTVTDALDFTATGTFNGGNVYSAEMSDGSGSFAAPTIVGTLNSSASGALTVNINIPGSMPAGSAYRIRVVASDPVTIGTDNGSDITIYDQPTVALGAYTDVCYDTPIFNLTGGTPTGGTYSGPGVAAGAFDPAAAGVGTHTIVYTYVDLNGCSGSDQQTLTVDACASVGEIGSINFVVYPNPASSSFTIGTEAQLDQIVLVDMSGRTVKRFDPNQSTFNVQNIPDGVYFLEIQSEGFVQSIELMIH